MTAQMVLGGDPNKLDVAGYSKGDIIAADNTGMLEPVTVGVDGTLLTADSVAPEGVDWQAGGGGGGGVPSNSVVTETSYSQGSTAGVAVAYSRGDHTHGTPPPFIPPVNLLDAPTIATNAALGNHFRVVVAGNRTLGAPTNPTDGQRIIWEITQDVVGNRLLSFNAVFVTPAPAPVLSLMANSTSYIGAIYRASRLHWDVIAFAKGF